MITPEDKAWLDDHKTYMYQSVRMSSENARMIYDIYNRLTGESKKPNGCGSCMRNTVRLIKFYYEKYTL